MAFGNVMGKLDEFNSKYQIGQKASSAFNGVKSATVKGSKQVAKVVTGKKSSKDSESAALPDESMWEHAEQHAAKPLEDRSRNGARTRAPLEEVRYDSYGGSADIWEHSKTNSFKTREEEKRAASAAAMKSKPRGPFDSSEDDTYGYGHREPERYKVFLPGYLNKSSYERANERAAKVTPARTSSNPFDEPWQ
ncbi:hypothetical protein KFL_000550010 [Klebsormidium nitens]|uniref:Uncharacterized protein n=1 Tax=Klebsormidium nitens TaxID=105231 RepID=A0A1Y1HX83_KLENI|nr:hypothetical protein KFL_000550010 [Klebsormidium nitens]|eukprot:GAQ80468.1 hypothetical protein KFL_000550010 [Klebsormidium nitens]